MYPALHWQLFTVSLPVTVDDADVPHGVHATFAILGLYVPIPHLEQVGQLEADKQTEVEKKPGMHRHCEELVDPLSTVVRVKLPEQSAHDEEPMTFLYVPTLQAMQTVELLLPK